MIKITILIKQDMPRVIYPHARDSGLGRVESFPFSKKSNSAIVFLANFYCFLEFYAFTHPLFFSFFFFFFEMQCQKVHRSIRLPI